MTKIIEMNIFIEEIRKWELNPAEATALAGMLIASAMDRQTELQKKNIEIQLEMSGLATDMFKKMTKLLNEIDEKEKWEMHNG